MISYDNEYKKIVIFGEDKLTNARIYNVIRKFLMIGEGKLNLNRNNYLETPFSIGEKKYTLTSISPALFPHKNDNEIDREEQALNQELLLSSDIIYLSVSIDSANLDYNLNLQKYFNQNKKKHLVVFSSSKIDKDEFESCFLVNASAQRITKNSEKSYFFPFPKERYPFLQLKQFVSNEFSPGSDFRRANSLANQEMVFKLTIFGPPNSGKSTLLNSLLNKKRSIVSSLAGTTREDVQSLFEWKGIFFEVKDTEGVTISKRNNLSILDDCQISWVILDSTEPITKKTLQIISLTEKCNRAVVIVLNKIDIASSQQIEERKEEINSRLKSFSFVPIVSISAQKRNNFPFLLATLQHSVKQSHLTFSKVLLAQQFSRLLEKNPPAAIRGKRLKVYYALHEKGFVHKFIVFVNNPKLVHFSYHRYIINYLRRNLGIDFLPLRIFFRKS